MENIKAAKSSKSGTVSEEELPQVKIMSRTQVGIGNFLTSKRKREKQSIDASHASGFNTLHSSGPDTTKNCRKTQKTTEGIIQVSVKHLLVIRRSRLKVVRSLFHLKVQNIKK